jgi:hypothetical protein
LERVTGYGIIAPRRSNNARLHRPWRATSDTSLAQNAAALAQPELGALLTPRFFG